MERKFIKMLGFVAMLSLTACASNPAYNGKTAPDTDVYDQKGMEISKIASSMSDILYQTMMSDLTAEEKKNAVDGKVGEVVVPKVAVTSFVDTDTYENAGYLGRSMAEMFVHELDRRGISVFEYKLTGAISITQDGEFVFSRNWKKVARQALVRHILAGTITRNDKGIVVVGRVINMATSTVVGSSTGFIPYERLPYCYRTGEKNCSINGVTSYDYYLPSSTTKTKNGVRETITTKSVYVSSASSKDTPLYSSNLTEKQRKEAQKRKDEEFVNNYYTSDREDFNSKYYVKGAKVPGTSTGNYERFMYNKRQSVFGGSSGKNPVIYPAQTYEYQGKLVRDVHDESQYSRVSD